MRVLGRQEIARDWNHTPKHIPGVQNTSADGIARRPRMILADKVRQLTHVGGPRGLESIDVVLETKNILIQHDGIAWNLTMNEADELIRLARLLSCMPRSTRGTHTVRARAPLKAGTTREEKRMGGEIGKNARAWFSREEY